MIKSDGSIPRGSGFKPCHRILDGCKQFASYYIKRKKLNIKLAKWGTQNKTKKKTGVHGCTHREEGYY